VKHLLRRVPLFLGLYILAYSAEAFAQVVAEKPLIDVLREILTAVQNSNFKLAASGLIVLIVYIARHYGSKYLPWLLTKLGTATLTAATAVGLGVSNYMAVGKRFDFQLLADATVIAVTAFLPFLPALPKPVELPVKP